MSQTFSPEQRVALARDYVPSQLGVEYNMQVLDTIAREAAPAFGWKPESACDSASPNLR